MTSGSSSKASTWDRSSVRTSSPAGRSPMLVGCGSMGRHWTSTTRGILTPTNAGQLVRRSRGGPRQLHGHRQYARPTGTISPTSVTTDFLDAIIEWSADCDEDGMCRHRADRPRLLNSTDIDCNGIPDSCLAPVDYGACCIGMDQCIDYDGYVDDCDGLYLADLNCGDVTCPRQGHSLRDPTPKATIPPTAPSARSGVPSNRPGDGMIDQRHAWHGDNMMADLPEASPLAIVMIASIEATGDAAPIRHS